MTEKERIVAGLRSIADEAEKGKYNSGVAGLHHQSIFDDVENMLFPVDDEDEDDLEDIDAWDEIEDEEDEEV